MIYYYIAYLPRNLKERIAHLQAKSATDRLKWSESSRIAVAVYNELNELLVSKSAEVERLFSENEVLKSRLGQVDSGTFVEIKSSDGSFSDSVGAYERIEDRESSEGSEGLRTDRFYDREERENFKKMGRMVHDLKQCNARLHRQICDFREVVKDFEKELFSVRLWRTTSNGESLDSSLSIVSFAGKSQRFLCVYDSEFYFSQPLDHIEDICDAPDGSLTSFRIVISPFFYLTFESKERDK